MWRFENHDEEHDYSDSKKKSEEDVEARKQCNLIELFQKIFQVCILINKALDLLFYKFLMKITIIRKGTQQSRNDRTAILFLDGLV